MLRLEKEEAMTQHKYLLLCFISLFFLAVPPALAQYPPSDNTSFGLSITHPRPWDLSIRIFGGYDDNVPLVPYSTFCRRPFERCAKESFYGGFTTIGNYRFIQNENWLAGAALSFDQVFHTKNIGQTYTSTDGKDYNLTSVNPSVFGRYFFGFRYGSWVLPMSAGMTYSYQREWLPIKGPLIWHASVHTLKWDLGADVTRKLRIGIDYNLSFQDFNRADSTNARDSTAQAVGLSGTYSFHGGLRQITLGYQYGTSNAESRNFDIENSHGIKAKFRTRVYGPFWLVLDAGATWEDYKGFAADFIPPPGRKWQRIDDYAVTRHITVDLFYKYTSWDSNQRQFEANRNNGGIGLTYRF
jgi:hypothetical protein